MDDFESADGDQSSGKQIRGGATAGLGQQVCEGVVIVKQLDALMNNLYKGNAEKLGQWKTASHVERASTAKAKTAVPAKSPQ
ncbi:MAG TPA: hypothetical protein VGF13_14725 [Verrucomicrobiae bacterium]